MKTATGHKNLWIRNVDKVYTNKAMSYNTYRQFMNSFLQQGKSITTVYTGSLVERIRLNLVRMNRLDKATGIIPELKDAITRINNPQTWLVLTEGWCSDAAQIIPVLNKAASLNENIALGFLLRDDNPGLMDAYLMDGNSRGIPKLIVLDENNNELFNWGPRPVILQELIYYFKANGLTHEAIKERIHKWYMQDKTITTQIDLLQGLNSIE